jgi:hypothetical protein
MAAGDRCIQGGPPAFNLVEGVGYGVDVADRVDVRREAEDRDVEAMVGEIFDEF